MAGFAAYIIFILYMMSSLRVVLVLSFLFNACNVWSSIDLIFFGAKAKSPKLFQVFSGALNIGMHTLLKIIAYGAIVGYFWIAFEDTGS